MNVLRLKDWLDHRLSHYYVRALSSSFKRYSPSQIHYSAVVTNPQYISLLGSSVGRGVWLYAMPVDSEGNRTVPEMTIGKGTDIGDYCHITCSQRVEIGESVLMGQGVFVSDSNHVYRDVKEPVIKQGLVARPVMIGSGTWLGNHAVIVGCLIGRNCVVGANAVVTRDVPDYCVVAGAPARVIRRYDAEAGSWR
jgi:acetyltransferase-like isoleucine patch superfamily enzyme